MRDQIAIHGETDFSGACRLRNGEVARNVCRGSCYWSGEVGERTVMWFDDGRAHDPAGSELDIIEVLVRYALIDPSRIVAGTITDIAALRL